jgi:enoyl-CoA hydratase
MSDDILARRDGRCLRITLNRPESGNAMSDDMAREVTRLLNGAGAESDFVVLEGAGADFCIGRASMGRPAAPAAAAAEALERRDQMEVVFDCYGAIRRCAVPVIGIVRGRALGFGCAVAALCDITLASTEARFQVPEMTHNIMPTMVMSALIDRVPAKAIGYLVYSTDLIDAQQAIAFGIVSRAVPPQALEQAEKDLCARLTATPRPALTGVKEYLATAKDMALPGAVDFARNIHAVVNSSSRMRRK